MVARFDGRNPRAEQWLTRNSARLITEITEGQRKLVRSVLTQGMEEGRGPRSVALDLVGRRNRATGRREGGLLGLTESGLSTVQNARAALMSGDPSAMEQYLRLKSRDRRFDPIVRRAIREGKPVPADQARKIAGRLADRLLYRRGETIARTELLQSLHAAQNEGIMQLIDAGKIRQDQVTVVWDAANDSATRPSHRAMDGQTRRLGEPFTSGDGNQLMFPGDTSLGAPASDIVNCRCRLEQRINFLADLP